MISSPINIILIPFFSAIFLALAEVIYPRAVKSLAALAALAFLGSALNALIFVYQAGPWNYVFGGWQAPFGIELRIDFFAACFVLILALALNFALTLTEVSKRQTGLFYCLLNLCALGLVGLVVSADVFNIYVFLEISSLSSYALIAVAGGRALIASFQYLILGSMGACFYLLGVGYLYIKTGTLNIADLSSRIQPVLETSSIGIAFILICIGMLLKMGVFPLHAWLPNAYCASLPVVRCFLAPIATKAAAFVLIKLCLAVFGLEYIWSLTWTSWISVFAAAGIIIAGLFVLAQRELNRLFSYLIVVEIGYILGGIFVGNLQAFYGAVFHVLADAMMLLVVFLALGTSLGHTKFDSLKILAVKRPIILFALICSVISIFGLPLTAGFVSKWYLLTGAIVGSSWAFAAAIIFSGLVTVVVLARIIESLWFSSEQTNEASNTLTANPYQDLVLSMALIALIIFGIFGQNIMNIISASLVV